MMKLSHIAIACPELAKLESVFAKLQLKVEERIDVPSEKVKVAMIPVQMSEDFRLELLEPTSDDSPIAGFLSQRPRGGMHHVCFEVDGIEAWEKILIREGFVILPPGIRKGARGQALFIHPKSMGGVLVELEEIHSEE